MSDLDDDTHYSVLDEGAELESRKLKPSLQPVLPTQIRDPVTGASKVLPRHRYSYYLVLYILTRAMLTWTRELVENVEAEPPARPADANS